MLVAAAKRGPPSLPAAAPPAHGSPKRPKRRPSVQTGLADLTVSPPAIAVAAAAGATPATTAPAATDDATHVTVTMAAAAAPTSSSVPWPRAIAGQPPLLTPPRNPHAECAELPAVPLARSAAAAQCWRRPRSAAVLTAFPAAATAAAGTGTVLAHPSHLARLASRAASSDAALLARRARAAPGAVAIYALPTHIAAVHDALIAAARSDELRGLAFMASVCRDGTAISHAAHAYGFFQGQEQEKRQCPTSPSRIDSTPCAMAVLRVWRRDAAVDALLQGLYASGPPQGLSALRHVFAEAVWPRIRDALLTEHVPDEMLVCEGGHSADRARFEVSCSDPFCVGAELFCLVPPPCGLRNVAFSYPHGLFLCAQCVDARAANEEPDRNDYTVQT